MVKLEATWPGPAPALVGVLAVLVCLLVSDERPRLAIELPRAPAPAPAPPPSAPPRGEERLEGLVLSVAGAPLVARVIAFDEDAPDAAPVEVLCDAEGRFTLEGLVRGRYLLVVEAPDHETTSRIVVTPYSGPLEFRLSPTGILVAEVVDARGAPVVGAVVSVGGIAVRPPRDATTDASGKARFESLPGGPYDVRAAASPFASRRVAGVDVVPAEETTVRLELAPAARVHGRVVDAAGNPLPGVELIVTEDALDLVPRTRTSDSDGRFSFDDLVARPYVLAARLDAYLPFGPVVVTPGDGELVFTLSRAATIRGRLVDSYGQPVHGAVVTLALARGTRQGGGTEQPSGATPPRANAPAGVPLGPAAPTAPLTAAGELGVTLGDLPPIPLGTIVATPNAQPSLAASTLGSVTDRNGVFLIVGVPPGTVQITAHHPAHPSVTSAPRVVAPGAIIDDWNLVFPPAGELVVRVVDARSRPLTGVAVEVRTDADDVPRSGVTDPLGRVRITGIAGIVVATAIVDGRAVARARGEARVGVTSDLVLMLEEARARLEGRILDDRHVPVANARVELGLARAGSPFEVFVMSDEDGRFFLDALPPPPYRLRVDHADFAPLELDAARPDASSRIELRLRRGGSIEGRVVDEDHERPIEGVLVGLVSDGAVIDEDATNARGEYAFHRISPDRYEVRFEHRDYLPNQRNVTLAESRFDAPRADAGTTELLPGFVIRGYVEDALGDPVARARVSLPRTLGAPGTTTDEGGRFELRGVAPGTYELEATHVRAGTARARRPVRGVARDVIDDVFVRLPERGSADEVRPDPALVRGVAVALSVHGDEIRIAWVGAGSFAEAAGLRVGDQLVVIDGEAITTHLDADRLLLGPVDVLAELRIRRGRAERRIRVGRELYRPPDEALLRR